MIAILDYGAGNLTSVRLALNHLGAETLLAASASDAAHADKIIFPGVGSAESGMQGLRARKFDALLADAFTAGKPVLSICLGMQMLFDTSEEDGGVDALGLIPGVIRKFAFADFDVKVPHIGWNTVEHDAKHPLWRNIPSGTAFYFVHSYYASTANASDAAGSTEYAGCRFTSVVAKNNFFATQFHPERSGKAGMTLLKNFLEWEAPKCC